MTGLTHWLIQGFKWLLRLYPPVYRAHFTEERLDVFRLAVEDAGRSGILSLFLFIISELCDLPGSILRETIRERVKMGVQPSFAEARSNWIEILAGLWLFIFIGPIMTIVPYQSLVFRQVFYYGRPVWLALLFLMLIAGSLIGWVRGFPRWSYPYLVPLIFILGVYGFERISRLLGSLRFVESAGVVSLIVLFALLIALLLLAGRYLLPLRRLYTGIRHDWTRLSFGLFTYAAFLVGFNGSDHLPPLNFQLLLPSLIIIAGALAYQVSVSQWQRLASLLVSLALGLGITAVNHTGNDAISPIAALFTVFIIVLPAICGLILPARAPQP